MNGMALQGVDVRDDPLGDTSAYFRHDHVFEA